MNNIAVLSSGGDAPGMNAAIRAVVRTAIHNGLTCHGIYRGYQGLIDNEIVALKTTDVSNIIQRGGTILKTARSDEFLEAAGRAKAAANLKNKGIEGLVVIGGDGSFRGAKKLASEHGIAVVGVPGTIDNDIAGTDMTIGFDTALNTAVSAIDKIRDTAEAHDRIFLVEVMGRDAGYLALHSAISCGAEHVFIPEQQEDLQQLIDDITNDQRRKKLTNIIIVAEGDEFGGAENLNTYINQHIPNLKTRVTILGHIQRGGSPTPNDRILASRLAFHAVEALINGENKIMIGIQNGGVVKVPFSSENKEAHQMADDLKKIALILSR